MAAGTQNLSPRQIFPPAEDVRNKVWIHARGGRLGESRQENVSFQRGLSFHFFQEVWRASFDGMGCADLRKWPPAIEGLFRKGIAFKEA